MVTYYCTNCWAEVAPVACTCPECGRPVEDAQANLTDKYVAALRHPQPETRLRAAWMLGRMRAASAVPALLALVEAKSDYDPYVLSAALKSLGQIGDRRAVRVLASLLADPHAPFMARMEAAYALAAIGGAEAWAVLEQAAEHDASERVRQAAARPLLDLTRHPA